MVKKKLFELIEAFDVVKGGQTLVTKNPLLTREILILTRKILKLDKKKLAAPALATGVTA